MPDNLSAEQRSYCMSRVKGRGTKLEKTVEQELLRCGFRFEIQAKELPGKPDIVFSERKLAIFVDGDFWHGYRFPAWCHKVPRFWQDKISKTRSRDQRNFRRLRRMGWTVIRLWQHDIEKDIIACVDRIRASADSQSS